jgi:NAD(P)-dependent dehydrogenase (short-subunit alcohol dehydrogenase family)
MEIGEPKRTFVATISLGRIEQPEDVAGMAAFLASRSSATTWKEATGQARRSWE